MLNFINAILGAALLIVGRRLCWLFVGVIGFLIGVEVATRFFPGSDWISIIAGLGLGVIFAILAIFLQTLAIGVAGFLGGGYILLNLAGLFSLDKGTTTWIIFIIGGVIGAVLITWLFDWAIITISSLAGSSMIVNAFHAGRPTAALVFIILVLIGVAVQGSALRLEKHGTQRHA
jgi:hypothetical protein